MTVEYEEPPTTGDPAADEALRRVARLADVPLAEHSQILREAQEALQTLLNTDAA